MVKRYRTDATCASHGQEDPDGRWVFWADAEARIAELEARERALTKFAEFCDYHHRSCDGLKGQHLDCDCGYTGARDELRAALASQSDSGKRKS